MPQIHDYQFLRGPAGGLNFEKSRFSVFNRRKTYYLYPWVTEPSICFFFFSFGLRSGAMTHHVRFRHFTWRQQSLARCGFFVIFHLGINIELGSQVLVRCNFEYKFDSSLSDFVWIAIGSIRFLSVGGHITLYQHEIHFFRR